MANSNDHYTPTTSLQLCLDLEREKAGSSFLFRFMGSALRSRLLSFLSQSSSSLIIQQWKLGFSGLNRTLTSPQFNTFATTATFNGADDNFGSVPAGKGGFLDLEEVEKVLTDVKADNVKVIPVGKNCDWAEKNVNLIRPMFDFAYKSTPSDWRSLYCSESLKP